MKSKSFLYLCDLKMSLVLFPVLLTEVKKKRPQSAILSKCNGWGEGSSQQEAWDAFRDICGHLKLQQNSVGCTYIHFSDKWP